MFAVTIHNDSRIKENQICHCFHFFPFYLPWSDETRCQDRSFFNDELQVSLFTLLSHPHQKALDDVPLHFLPLQWYHLHIWGCWYFSGQSWFQLVIHPAQHFAWCTAYTPSYGGLAEPLRLAPGWGALVIKEQADRHSWWTNPKLQEQTAAHITLWLKFIRLNSDFKQLNANSHQALVSQKASAPQGQLRNLSCLFYPVPAPVKMSSSKTEKTAWREGWLRSSWK